MIGTLEDVDFTFDADLFHEVCCKFAFFVDGLRTISAQTSITAMGAEEYLSFDFAIASVTVRHFIFLKLETTMIGGDNFFA